MKWFITDKASNRLEMSQEMRSRHAALFCKIDVWKTSQFSKKNTYDGVLFWKNCKPTCFSSFHSTIRSGMFYKKGLLKNLRKLAGKQLCQSFFLEKIAHHQACKFIKKRHQHRYFNVNFAKLLKTLCRTPPVSASNFPSTFLTFRLCKTHIYVFPALLFLDISKPLHVPDRS